MTEPTGETPSDTVDVPASPPRAVGRGTIVALGGILVAVTFFVAYAYAARSAPGVAADGAAGAECDSGAAECGTAAAEADACGGDCGGTASTAAPVGRATLGAGVQRIDVDVSAGYFDPTVIELAAGVPTLIVFGEGSGCLAEVQFPQFGIRADLTSGGATIEIPALDPGQYPFSCGMEMVYGALIVR